MALMTEIPCELVAFILQSLDDLRSLTPALLTCRHIYSSFKQSPGISGAIIRRQVTSALLHCSVAAMEASHLPRPRDSDSIRDLLDTLYNEPAKLADRVSSIPMPLLLKMERTHNVVYALATDFAAGAWNRLRQSDKSMPAAAILSSAEYFRFCRAFYRVEIFYDLFSGRSYGVSGVFEESMNNCFFSRHPPWENEQLGCVHDFLEARLATVAAHDVYFGEMSIDYLTDGVDNGYRQLWLTQGVEFIHRLITEDSYEAKKALLKVHSDKGRANLPAALFNVLRVHTSDDTVLGATSKEELLSIIPRRENIEDTNKGPHESRYAAHRDLPVSACLMLDENDWLRDRAYVLWDWDRVEKHHLLDVFQAAAEDSRSFPTDEEFDEMYRSFEERSEIWQKGGSGYWSKDDNSRIIWPEKH